MGICCVDFPQMTHRVDMTCNYNEVINRDSVDSRKWHSGMTALERGPQFRIISMPIRIYHGSAYRCSSKRDVDAVIPAEAGIQQTRAMRLLITEESNSGLLCPGRHGRPSHGGERKTPQRRADGLAPVGSIELKNRGDSILVRP